MNIKLIAIGKANDDYIQQGFDDYESRVKHYINFNFIEINTIKHLKGKSPEDIKLAESSILLKQFLPNDYIILLDEKGKHYDSKNFADLIQNYMLRSIKNLAFVIGGAYGFDKSIYERAQAKLSLSSMTFSHLLTRLIFMEQLYRAMTIINNQPYHHE